MCFFASDRYFICPNFELPLSPSCVLWLIYEPKIILLWIVAFYVALKKIIKWQGSWIHVTIYWNNYLKKFAKLYSSCIHASHHLFPIYVSPNNVRTSYVCDFLSGREEHLLMHWKSFLSTSMSMPVISQTSCVLEGGAVYSSWSFKHLLFFWYLWDLNSSWDLFWSGEILPGFLWDFKKAHTRTVPLCQV